jgi:hypothetical protein
MTQRHLAISRAVEGVSKNCEEEVMQFYTAISGIDPKWQSFPLQVDSM